MALGFRDAWSEAFYEQDRAHKKIPTEIQNALFRKLQVFEASVNEFDLRVPPGNRVERLKGNFSGWCSIRVNKQYRLIFRWEEGVALDTYLDPHSY